MKLKIVVMALTSMIFLIRMFCKASADVFNLNFKHCFGASIEEIVIYFYQASVVLILTYIKRIPTVIVLTFLITNMFLIILYTVPHIEF
ncbi:hypothetical protein ASG21_04145 [Chryseobacterium sp. Leaf394]|nr:hypothetical protein ASG21_04145 [Chryseobacterium sp. Leaf394]